MKTDYVEMRNIIKKFQNFRLDNISLDVPQGKIVGFIGENGAGKSTTINLLLNSIEKDSGEIAIFGLYYPENEIQIKQSIGVALDECVYPEELTARDVGIILAGVYKDWDNAQYYNFLEKFSVPQNQNISTFSRGMKMKLDIITAMSHHAKLLVFDEATTGLDPVARDEILNLFMEYVKTQEASILFSSHIISDVEKAADIVVLIDQGHIIFQERKEILLQRYCICENQIDAPAKYIAKKVTGEGVQYLLEKTSIKSNIKYRTATLEEILLFFMKGEIKCED